jgi:hypothetical protein
MNSGYTVKSGLLRIAVIALSFAQKRAKIPAKQVGLRQRAASRGKETGDA